MILGVRHTGLVVQDLDAALDFWCGTMSFAILRRLEEEGPEIDAMLGIDGVRLTTVKLSAQDNNVLELLYFHSHRDKKSWKGSPFSTGFTHLALTVSDVDSLYKKLIGRIGFARAHPQRSVDGKVKAVYVRGPENILIELVEEL